MKRKNGNIQNDPLCFRLLLELQRLNRRTLWLRSWPVAVSGVLLNTPRGSRYDGLVDEVGPLCTGQCFDDDRHFLRGIKEACLGILFLSAAPFACSSPLGIFLLVLIHSLIFFSIFAAKTRRWEGFPSLLDCQIQISNLILTFQTLNEMLTFIRRSGFRFSYSFQGFRNPLCQSLIDTTKVRKIFDFIKFFQDYFTIIPQKELRVKPCYLYSYEHQIF